MIHTGPCFFIHPPLHTQCLCLPIDTHAWNLWGLWLWKCSYCKPSVITTNLWDLNWLIIWVLIGVFAHVFRHSYVCICICEGKCAHGWEGLWEKYTPQKCNFRDQLAPTSPHPLVSATYQQPLKLLLHPWIIHWWVQSLMIQFSSKELTSEHYCLGYPDFNAWTIRGHFRSKANLLLVLIVV